jgi:putative hydrolase of the HAD superfamily
VAKPNGRIFTLACTKLNLHPREVLHVGDDAELDVVGAHQAGLRTAWINRTDATWTHTIKPDVTVHDLGELADWLDNRVRLSA